ncbi:MAG: HlyD family secretion protein [Gemmatimonadota bacterium]|nr:HlyD family secretion protein [Gemmatimonadota bacterium]
MRRKVIGVLIAAIVVFVWYVLADRHTPFTDQARVAALVVPIVPEVGGYITEIDVRLHSTVTPGERILQIDPRPYQIAVDGARAALEDVVQQVSAQSAGVEAAAAQLGVAEAALDRAQRNYNRVEAIQAQNPGALSQSDRDQAETALESAQERRYAAEASLEAARRQLGAEGDANARVRSAIASLQQAELNLAFTTITAPANGAVENFTVDVGHYAAAGQPLGVVITDNELWIEADLRENNLGNLDPGDPVDIVLDVAPGRVFRGSVRSVGFGVQSGFSGSRGQLEQVSGSSGWLREPQRFPVAINVEREEVGGLLRVGAQADIVVYTARRPVLNAIAWLRHRIVSYISYVR